MPIRCPRALPFLSTQGFDERTGDLTCRGFYRQTERHLEFQVVGLNTKHHGFAVGTRLQYVVYYYIERESVRAERDTRQPLGIQQLNRPSRLAQICSVDDDKMARVESTNGTCTIFWCRCANESVDRLAVTDMRFQQLNHAKRYSIVPVQFGSNGEYRDITSVQKLSCQILLQRERERVAAYRVHK